MIELNGMELTIKQVIAVARHNEQVRISEPAKEKINRARTYVDEKLAQKADVLLFGHDPASLAKVKKAPDYYD